MLGLQQLMISQHSWNFNNLLIFKILVLNKNIASKASVTRFLLS